MSRYSVIKAATDAYIKTNGRQEITGAILNAVMIATIDSLGRFYQFVGYATPDTDPGNIDQNVAYLAGTPGTYTHLGGFSVNPGEIAVIKFDGEWKKEVVIVIPSKVSQLENDLGFITNAVSDLINYYNKTETFSKTEVQNILNGYYDKDEVDSIVSAITRQSYVIAWDGTAEPVVGNIPAGVSVTWGGNPYVGTLPASADTAGRIYMVSNGAGYDEYITTEDGGYSWVAIGSTGIDLSGYVTQAVFDQLKDEVTDIEPMFITKQTITDFSGYTKKDYIVIADGVYGSSSSSKHIELPVKPGQRVRILAHATNGTRFAFYFDLDHPGSGLVNPYVLVNGEKSILLSAGQMTTVSVPEGAYYLILNVGSTSTPYTPQEVVIYESLEETAEEQLIVETESKGANLENPDALLNYWAIVSRDGRILRTSTSTKGITDYIPVKGGDLYCNNATTSGTYGRHAVYDQDKVFIRSFSGNQYTYEAGDYYTRWTVSLDSTQKVITRPTFGTPRPMAYDAPLVQKVIKDSDFVVTKGQVPALHPASGLVGEPGITITADTFANESLTISTAPAKLKPNCSLAFYGKVTGFEYIEFGCGKGNNTGWGVRIDGTNVKAVAYNSGSTIAVDTKAHGLTIGTFIYVSLEKTGTDIKVRMMSFGGEYVGNVTFSQLEAYGTPFAYASENSSLTDVQFSWTSKDLRKQVWFFGASYCSLYQSRMLTQLIQTYGVDNFAIIAEAGNDFSDIMPSVMAALEHGTPKFLVCGVGMNTSYPAVYWYYLKKLENLCKARGMELVLCTIPYPSGGSKQVINSFVTGSGYRYIDLYHAVSSDENGTWYPGYCDDGVHPTIIGAKAMAARILIDLPEILNY